MAAATTWQLAYRTSGVQPWHLDPGLTAVGFTTGHLGFTDVRQETSRRVLDREAWIGVGHNRPDRHMDTHMGTTALVHLARMGAGADAPLAAKWIGGASLFLWTGIIIFGRLLTFYRPFGCPKGGPTGFLATCL